MVKYLFSNVISANIDMKDVFVADRNKLEKAKDFSTGTNVILEHSRILIAWNAAGIAANAYESSLRYALKRVQFGKSIASFQIT